MSLFACLLTLCPFFSDTSDVLVPRSWPDKIYRITDADVAHEVTDLIRPLSSGTYIMLDSTCLPFYDTVEIGATVALSVFHPRPLDTLRFRVIMDTATITTTYVDSVFSDLRQRMQVLYLGKYIKWRIDGRMVDSLNTLRRGVDLNAICDKFHCVGNEVTIVVNSAFSGDYYADIDNKVVRIASGGLLPRVLLHEIGHLLGLQHPVGCCNTCTGMYKLFMYPRDTIGTVRDEATIQDWLEIGGACRENFLCNDCSTGRGALEAHGGGGGSPSYPQILLLPKVQAPKDTLVSPDLAAYLECIDCGTEGIATFEFKFADFKKLAKNPPTTAKLLVKYNGEYAYYHNERPPQTQGEIDYVNGLIKQRQVFYIERLLLLVELKLADKLNVIERLILREIERDMRR